MVYVKTRKHTTAPAERPEAALKAQIESSTRALAEEMQAGKSERFQALLKFWSRFWQYSVGNQMLIAMQRPDATRVAGYRTWERMGYHVAKGEHAIRILAPRTFRKAETDANGNETERTGMYFTSVPVFDVSQLNADELAARPLPEFYYSLGSDDETEALYARMVAALDAAGIKVEQRAIDGGAQGYSAGGYIAIREGLASRNRVRTLAHEWAHELLHQGADKLDATKEVREWHAEATAYVVLAHFGLHNEFSSDYVQSWQATPETLLAELGAVQKAAAQIIRTLETSESADTEQD